MQKDNNKSGFTLIEISIVIIIIGLSFAAAIQSYHLWLKKHAMDTTQSRISKIESAVETFVQDNGYLPCPAPRVAYNDPGYGVATDCATAPATGTASDTGRDGRNVRIGAVPIRTLGLKNEYIQDGWRNNFTYATTEELSVNGTTFSNTLGAIEVKRKDGDSWFGTGNEGTGLFVVISHGEGGDCNSGMQGSDANLGDIENCDDDSTFLFTPEANTNFASTEYFDDLVGYSANIEDDQLVNVTDCSDKGMIYAPADGTADADGCIVPPASEALTDFKCDPGKYLAGFQGKQPLCENLPQAQTPNCSSDQVFTSDGNGGFKCVAVAQTRTPNCKANQTLTSDGRGGFRCVAVIPSCTRGAWNGDTCISTASGPCAGKRKPSCPWPLGGEAPVVCTSRGWQCNYR